MRRALVLPLVGAVLAAGCGVGEGASSGTGGATVTVTRDFGAREIGRAETATLPGGETAMRLLQKRFDVQTRYGGNFVSSIEGLEGGGGRTDWFFYVNGIESEVGASGFDLHPGDRVWWDHHDWSTTMRIPAVVGSFPEPFVSGYQGKRRPVVLGCATDSRAACDAVADRLVEAGVKAVSKAAIPTPAGPEVVRVLIGRWADVRRDRSAEGIGRGPAASGVYARFAGAGSALELLDEQGRVVRSVAAGGGLVAATRYEDQQPTWVVTGVDAAGVTAAAAAFGEDALRDRFAVAVEGGRPVALPVREEAAAE